MIRLIIILLISIASVKADVVSSVTPGMDQTSWDAAWFQAGSNNVTASACSPTGTTTNIITTCAEYFAWSQDFWVRAYLSMAVTTGDTKYLDKAKEVIDFELTKRSPDGACGTNCGWGYEINNSQYFLDTAVINQTIASYIYVVWKDKRFSAYRTGADAYLAVIEPLIHLFDSQWTDNSPMGGLNASFYRYATCSGGRALCGTTAIIMYNQGAIMAKAGLLVYRIYQLKGLTPDSGYLDKATKAADYFLKFATFTDGYYLWNYEGARTDVGTSIEDISHAHLDLGLLTWSNGLGTINNDVLKSLSNTLQKSMLANVIGDYPLMENIDNTTTISNTAYRALLAVDWIELVDYNPLLLDEIINYFNANLVGQASYIGALGWAEILRKKANIQLVYGL